MADAKPRTESGPARRARPRRLVQAAVVIGLVAVVLGVLQRDAFVAGVAGERGSALWVEYPRLVRSLGPVELRVHLGQGAVARDVSVWVDQRYLEDLRLVDVSPLPSKVEASSERATYTFRLETGMPSVVTFRLNPGDAGRHRGALGLVGSGERVEFQHVVYP